MVACFRICDAFHAAGRCHKLCDAASSKIALCLLVLALTHAWCMYRLVRLKPRQIKHLGGLLLFIGQCSACITPAEGYTQRSAFSCYHCCRPTSCPSSLSSRTVPLFCPPFCPSSCRAPAAWSSLTSLSSLSRGTAPFCRCASTSSAVQVSHNWSHTLHQSLAFPFAVALMSACRSLAMCGNGGADFWSRLTYGLQGFPCLYF